MASPFLPVNILIRDDFPTLDLPIKANSGGPPLGQALTWGYEQTNSALVISKGVRSELGEILGQN